MEWQRAAFVVDRFERLALTNLRELKVLHRSIVENEQRHDSAESASDKRNARRKIDQLLSGLCQILNLRTKLNEDAQEQFDLRIEPVRLQIQSTVNALNAICAVDENSLGDFDGDANIYDEMYKQSMSSQPSESEKSERQLQAESLRLKAEQVKMDAEETKRLQRDIEDLNDVMVQLGQLVHAQHEVVDSIEEHVEKSRLDVRMGHSNLKKAQAAQSAKYPLLAAAVGGVALGGPVGIAAGSAVAGVVAAVGGVFAGLYSGRFLRKKTQEAANHAD